MRIKDATGVNFREATDFVMRELMSTYGISRKDAPRLLAECLIRNCVVEEIIGTAAVLIPEEDKN